MDASKQCTGCQEVKPLTAFYRHKSAPDGHIQICATCYVAAREARMQQQHEVWEQRQEERRREVEEEQRRRKLRFEQQEQQWEEERQRHREERTRQIEQQRVEWQQQEQQREECHQGLLSWFHQLPDQRKYVHPDLMRLPKEEDQYPALSIDAIVQHYYRWKSKSAVCEWLNYLASLDYCVIDTETTGGRRFSQLIEITILNKQGTLLYTSLLQPTTSIEPMATSVHGLTWNEVKDAPRFSEVYQDIYTHLAGKLVLAYNASFDIHSLFRTARAFQVPFPRLQVGCLMYAYSKLKGERCEESMQYKRVQLVKACMSEGISIPGLQEVDGHSYRTDFHRAEQDARYLYDLLQCMLKSAKL